MRVGARASAARPHGDDVRVRQGREHHRRRLAPQVAREAGQRRHRAAGAQVDDAKRVVRRRRIRADVLRHRDVDGDAAPGEAARERQHHALGAAAAEGGDEDGEPPARAGGVHDSRSGIGRRIRGARRKPAGQCGRRARAPGDDRALERGGRQRPHQPAAGRHRDALPGGERGRRVRERRVPLGRDRRRRARDAERSHESLHRPGEIREQVFVAHDDGRAPRDDFLVGRGRRGMAEPVPGRRRRCRSRARSTRRRRGSRAARRRRRVREMPRTGTSSAACARASSRASSARPCGARRPP